MPGLIDIAPLERAVALRPKGANERFWLARAYLLAGRAADAQGHIDALRSLDATAAAGLSPARAPGGAPVISGWDAGRSNRATTR